MKLPEIVFSPEACSLNPEFNFQLNRVIQWNGGRLEDVTDRLIGLNRRDGN